MHRVEKSTAQGIHLLSQKYIHKHWPPNSSLWWPDIWGFPEDMSELASIHNARYIGQADGEGAVIGQKKKLSSACPSQKE